jgi:hypothetical protein
MEARCEGAGREPRLRERVATFGRDMMVDIWEEHDVVYHYTTQSGLKGMLESQTFHATYFAFLNDSQEIYQIRPRLVEIPLGTSIAALGRGRK